MSVFRTAGSAAAKRLGWPGSRPRRPSHLGWPGVVGHSALPVELSETDVVSRETEDEGTEVVSRGTAVEDASDQRPLDGATVPDDEPTAKGLPGDELAGNEASSIQSGDVPETPVQQPAGDLPTVPVGNSPVADAESASPAIIHAAAQAPPLASSSEPVVVSIARDGDINESLNGSLEEALPSGAPTPGTSGSPDSTGEEPTTAPASEDSAPGVAETSDSDGPVAGAAPISDVAQSTSATEAQARPITVRAPGPRRAKFDRDEFDNDPGSDEPSATRIERDQKDAGFPAPTQTRVFVVANQKGGVGKTTTSVNLAAALALGGLNVLVLDLDPQGNASTALGIDHGPGIPGTYEVLIEGAAIEDHLVPSPEAPHLQVLPATIDLAGAEIQLVSSVARENRLRKALRTYLTDHPVDYVFLDCPPSLGLITLNALVAASEILIPIQCEYYALEGVSQLVRTINLVKGELNEGLEVSTVLLTMYDARTRLAAQVAEEVRSYFTEQTLPTVIPRSVRISEAPSYGQTVLTYHPDSAGAVSYLEAAQEIARRGAPQEGQ